MVKQSDIDMIVDESIVSAAKQVLNGLISVSEFVFMCDRYGWVVSSINQVTNSITVCTDPGLNDEDTNQPILIWKDITVS